MNPRTQRSLLPGPAGLLACAVDDPTQPPCGVAVLCHPHPQHGGTMDNKVVMTLARAALQRGYRAVRFNFRGVGGSGGHWDHGIGEIDDALAVVEAHRQPGLPLMLGGFSFGGYVASHAAARQPDGQRAERLVLVAPAVINFEMAVVPDDTLVLHGEQDEVVPLPALLDWVRPLALPVTVLPGAGHFFHGQLALLKQCVLRSWPPPGT